MTDEPFSLTDKTAVVTGAGRGLGQHVARGLAERGARVAVVARTAAQVEQTVDQIRASGGQAIGAAMDASDIDSVARLARQVETAFGPATILINAAGIFGPFEPIAGGDAHRWIETIRVNAIGPYLTCRAFLPGMLAAGWGRIVNFSSAASLHPPGPLNSAYGTSKVALNQFTRHLAAELAGTNVTANVIHPGEVQTQMWADVRDGSQSAGDAGEGHRQWAATVAATGGDDPQKALDLILDLIADADPNRTGKFLWIAGGMQTPIASW